ncbi:MAG: DUF262 domain-containing protein [Treponema sp.]|nr:DUF262 domain-containing protein [Treponema sp.]
MGFQNYGIKTIKDFLSGAYYIPNYQREYSWDNNELEDFWLDLMHTANSEEKRDHFFGQIVIHNNDDLKKKFIIDGQQRTITSTIFVRVLQEYFQNISSNSSDADISNEAKYKAQDIEGILVGRYTTNNNELHLTLDEVDAEYFRTNIQLKSPSREKPKGKPKASQERLRKAYWFFYDKINDAINNNSSYGNAFELLLSLYKTFTDRFIVLYMEATKLDEAFIVFETLNARGKDLETADLLKNYIFSQAKNNIDAAQKNWNKMIASLDKSDPTKFIRTYWNSSHSLTREKELYKEITRNVVSPRDSNNLLEDLSKFAPIYHDIVNPEDCSYFSEDKIINSLVVLKTLKASTFYPIIISMKRSEVAFTDDDISKVLSKVIDYIFRNFTICGNVANSAEKVFSDISKKIYDGVITNTDEICNELSKEIITDQEFEVQFNVWRGTKSTKETIRYILRKIYQVNPKNKEINMDNNAVHIEHIMPEVKTNWPQISDEDHDAYLWRLGNLTLLNGIVNQAMSNKTFSEKKCLFPDSKIEENCEIAKNEKWGIKEIEARQEALCKIALTIWTK